MSEIRGKMSAKQSCERGMCERVWCDSRILFYVMLLMVIVNPS